MDTTSLYEEDMKDPEFAKLMAEESLILEVTEKVIKLSPFGRTFTLDLYTP